MWENFTSGMEPSNDGKIQVFFLFWSNGYYEASLA